MKAIIPVAGHGTRLEPHSLNIQKCLLPVAGKPVLEHIIDRLVDVGIDDIILIIGHLGNQVLEFSKTYLKANITCIVQKQRLGLGHAIFQALHKLEEPILIVLGDSILELNYKKLISSSVSTLGVFKVEDPKRFGIVKLEGNKILSVIEKPDIPPTNLALIGIYYINSQIELYNGIKYLIDNNIRTKNEFQLTDAFGIMIESGHVFFSLEINECLDCGIPNTYLSTNKKLLKIKGDNAISKSAKIVNSELRYCTVTKNCIIKNSKLNNVILLPGSKIINKNLKNTIIGCNEIIIT